MNMETWLNSRYNATSMLWKGSAWNCEEKIDKKREQLEDVWVNITKQEPKLQTTNNNKREEKK